MSRDLHNPLSALMRGPFLPQPLTMRHSLSLFLRGHTIAIAILPPPRNFGQLFHLYTGTFLAVLSANPRLRAPFCITGVTLCYRLLFGSPGLYPQDPFLAPLALDNYPACTNQFDKLLPCALRVLERLVVFLVGLSVIPLFHPRVYLNTCMRRTPISPTE